MNRQFKVRLFVLKDPEAQERGYSLKGIKVPLTSFPPVDAIGIRGYDDLVVAPSHQHKEFWPVPTELLFRVRPDLKRHLKDCKELLIPTDWCDIAIIDHWDDINWKW